MSVPSGTTPTPKRSFSQPSPLRVPARPASSATIDRVVAELRVSSVGELSAVSRDTMARVFDLLSLDARARVEVELAVARASTTTDGNTVLARAVDQQRLVKIFPWVADEERALRQLERFSLDWQEGKDQAQKSLRSEFVSRAKAGLLGPLEAIVGQYCLFTTNSEYGCFLLAALLLRVPPEDRVTTHNWAIAQELPRATKEAYGTAIARLQVPLFPVLEALEAANTRLLQGKPTPSVSGGSASTVDPLGDGWLGVQQAQDGSYGVETAPLDTVIKAELDGLRAELRALRSQYGGRGGRGGRHQDQNSYQQQPYQQQQPAHQYQQQQRGNQQYQQPQQQRYNKKDRRGPAGSGDLQPAQQSFLDDLFKPHQGTAQQPPQATAPPAPASTSQPPSTVATLPRRF